MIHINTPVNPRLFDVVSRKGFCAVCWQARTKVQGPAWISAASLERLLARIMEGNDGITPEAQAVITAKLEDAIKRNNQKRGN